MRSHEIKDSEDALRGKTNIGCYNVYAENVFLLRKYQLIDIGFAVDVKGCFNLEKTVVSQI